MNLAIQSIIKKIKLNTGNVYLEDFEIGKGKIIVEAFGTTYSYFWGAMGNDTSISDFITSTSDSYFVNKLLGARGCYEFCQKKTFRNLRNHIKEYLPWYKHLEFQKEMREEIKNFQQRCDSLDSFVYLYSTFSENLDYTLIDDLYDQKEIKSIICSGEPWHFIGEKLTREYIHLCRLHKDICTHIGAMAKETY